VNLINQKNGGLNAILMLNKTVRQRKARSSGFGDVYGDAGGSGEEDEDDEEEDEEESLDDGRVETYAQRVYLRGNNEITGVIGISARDRRISESKSPSS
jgi:hypothetical protein